uniref:Uncharacterized protein n=2 Tax=Macrostomum lignano TaxID=282301 RepID=A0A1I8G9Q5_9PLAT
MTETSNNDVQQTPEAEVPKSDDQEQEQKIPTETLGSDDKAAKVSGKAEEPDAAAAPAEQTDDYCTAESPEDAQQQPSAEDLDDLPDTAAAGNSDAANGSVGGGGGSGFGGVRTGGGKFDRVGAIA